MELRNVQFGSDADRLIGKIKGPGGRAWLPISGDWRIVAAAAAGVLVIALGGIRLFKPEWLPWTPRRDYTITVINRHKVPIEKFYFSNCGDKSFGVDRLGPTEVIVRQRTFDMYDKNRDCCRDMLAVFSDGRERARMKVDVCREDRWLVD